MATHKKVFVPDWCMSTLTIRKTINQLVRDICSGDYRGKQKLQLYQHIMKLRGDLRKCYEDKTGKKLDDSADGVMKQLDGVVPNPSRIVPDSWES